MEITKQMQGEVCIVSVTGRIDTEGAQKLDDELHAAAETTSKMVLDLSKVSYINSAGLRTLADVLTTNQHNGGSLYLAALNPRVQRVLEIIGFEKFFQIFPDTHSALKEF